MRTLYGLRGAAITVRHQKPEDPSATLQLVISGIAQGCIYGLIALGFVLIYKATETVSFAQGELMMLGAFFGLAAMTMMGFPSGSR